MSEKYLTLLLSYFSMKYKSYQTGLQVKAYNILSSSRKLVESSDKYIYINLCKTKNCKL